MICRKIRRRVPMFVFALVISFSILFSFSSDIYADYTSVTLSPATGTIYGSNTAISVYANSGSDEFVGVDINLSFTGSVDYVSSAGAARCTSFNVTQGSGTLNIECLSLNHETDETYNGLVATLYFKATGEGTSVFSITSVDPATTTTTGGTYTLSAEAASGGDDLPDSGLFEDSLSRIFLGTFFLITGVLISRMKTEYSFLGKVKSAVAERKEKKEEKRKNKWESKF